MFRFRLVRLENGSVSLFLIMIVAVIFFLNAVLIDYARIMYTKRQTEYALQAAIRSVLSAYDPELQKYGLYGLSSESGDPDTKMKDVLNQNLTIDGNFFRYTDPTMENASITFPEGENLGNHTVIYRQILEDMKYKAPIELSRSILNSLADIRKSKAEIKKVKDLEKVAGIAEERKKSMDNAADKQKNAKERADKLFKEMEGLSKPSSSDTEADRKKRNQRIEEISKEADEIKKTLDQSKDEMNKAQEKNKEMSDLLNDPSVDKEAMGQTDDIKDIDYVQYKADMNTLKKELDDGVDMLSRDPDRISDKKNSFSTLANQVTNQQDERKKKDAENETKKKGFLSQAAGKLGEIDRVVAQAKAAFGGHDKEYNQLKQYYNEYQRLNNWGEGNPLNPPSSGEDPEEAGKASLDLFDSIADKLQTVFVEQRNRVYLNEYALLDFSNFTTGSGANDLAESKNHKLTNQEAEYILYGHYSSEANLGSSLGEIFIIRYGIRCVDALRVDWIIPLPPQIKWIAVLAWAAIATLDDMMELVAGNAVEFSDKVPQVKFTYKDYLRIFMLLHGDEVNMLSRMQALIQLEKGLNLAQVRTAAQCSATTSVRMWFVPGAIKALSLTNVLAGKVKGDRYLLPGKVQLNY